MVRLLAVLHAIRLRACGVCVVDEVSTEREDELMIEFTIIKKLNPRDNPNDLGEYLRNEFFNQDKGEYGCYSTFEIRSGVKKLPSESIEYEYKLEYFVFEKIVLNSKVIMKYFWDGDGTLEFHFDDETYLYNGDCKKDYRWVYMDKDEMEIFPE